MIHPALVALTARFGAQIETGSALRDQHGAGDSWHAAAPPDAVLFATTTADVSDALAICHEHGFPVVAFGHGSSIEGQTQAVHGGLSIDLTAMTAILRVSPEDMDATVECGVTRQQLNEHLRDTGLFLPIDVGAHATLGGLASTRASGTMTVRHGTMRALVMGLTVVLPDGEVIHTGGRARKSSSGYDLSALFVGAEGTLGIITELTLRLTGIPEAARAGMYSFARISDATQTVVEALQCGLSLNRIELLDALQMRAINAYNKTDHPETATLMIDMTGSAAQVAADQDTFGQLAAENGATLAPCHTTEEYNALWALRHSALYAARALRPGCKSLSTDVCVPVSELPGIIDAIQSEIAAAGVVAPLHGHVGDGNFHLVMLFDPEVPEEQTRVKQLNARLVAMALECGGTATGEHGVGLGKKAFMEAEHGGALNLMRRLKQAVDPKGILNPGKIFDL
ncbi:FAD-binding oxidoreductase [Puniceibacterium sediminis]|uniref:D-lactate dehydrogenase (cytochrome) n=1 Tax=Puniceibacterium sediminis TaxID=1608407 RepID=A0A238YY20_9RHOB|nr:FAD-linked oxidase C-terminal domain-containing protein [Puniceibacterium sediminis]SNR75533.1 D-lactate dehydrogenase (cytochrome) [Puniceibacterium sediminis]